MSRVELQSGARLRIGLYHPYPHRMGGSQQVTLLLARHLPTVGYEPVIVCPEDGIFTTAAREAGIEVLIAVPGPSWRIYGRGSRGLRAWLSLRHARELVRYWRDLRDALRAHRIALLHCHNIRAVIMAAMAGRLAGLPTVWHVHGAPPDGLAGWFGPLIGLVAQRSVLVSLGMLDYWSDRRWMLRSRRVVHNGIDDVAPQAEWARTDPRPTIVVVGTLSPIKGQDLLLAAMPGILERVPDVRCLLVGKDWADGYYERRLRELVCTLRLENCVEFLGERRDVPSWLAASDCVVIPSRSEAFGMVAVEAMVLGKPVVAAATGGLRDIVDPGITGFLVAPTSAEELIEAVVRVLTDRELAQRMGLAARQRLPAHFSARRMTQRFGLLYDESLKSRAFAGRTLRHRLWHGAFVRKQWTIGVSTAAQDMRQDAIERINLLAPLPNGDFLADPFLVPGSRGRVLLCEWMKARHSRGIIARVELDEHGSITELKPVIERRFHLSYPFTFRHEERLYCCPEAAESGELTLYRLSADARSVESSCVLLANFPALDPTIFEHEGRWWLLCTSAANGQSLSHLHAFHAPAPLGPWTQHAANPIVVDVRRARAAGTVFLQDGHLYRPGQDCAEAYGGGINVSRIVRLTPDEYCEEPAWRLDPPVSQHGRHGIHTLSVDGDVVAIDACTDVSDPLAWVSRLRRHI
jgi:glycosyltransferase involved in cell wall biosynthesis